MISQPPPSIKVPHVSFVLPQKPSSHSSFNQRSNNDWSFTKRGMVEDPPQIFYQKGKQRYMPADNTDYRLKSVLEKGSWHRARNSDLRWNQASVFSQTNGRSKFVKSASSLASSRSMPSAYEISLRNKGTLPSSDERPVTGRPATREVLKTSPGSSNCKTDSSTSLILTSSKPVLTESQSSALLNVTSPPLNNQSLHTIRYSQEHKRKPRPRPKTSSAATLPMKRSDWTTQKHQSAVTSKEQWQFLFPWSAKRMNSEYDMKRAYSDVTGERVQKGASLNYTCHKPEGFNNEQYIGDVAESRSIKFRNLKSAPLASLLQRQQMPSMYTIETQNPVTLQEDQVTREATRVDKTT